MTFKLIQGNKDDVERLRQAKKQKRRDAYFRGYSRNLDTAFKEYEETGELSNEYLKRIVFYGVKIFTILDIDTLSTDQLNSAFESLDYIKFYIGELTPIEFIQMFPIDKVYDGDKTMTKDYFFTMEEIDKLNAHEKLRDQVDVFELFWDYQNTDIRLFLLSQLKLISRHYKNETGKELMEEFLREQGVDLYVETTNDKGKKILMNDQTGEEIKVLPKIPRHLKLVQ